MAGETHGLIAAPADQTPAVPWGVAWTNFTDTLIGATAQGTALGTGQANTAAIVAQTIENQHCVAGAAYICDNLVEGGYSDWYLPSKDELDKLYLLYMTYTSVGESGNFNPSGYYQAYWSSSESTGAGRPRARVVPVLRQQPRPRRRPPEHDLQDADLLGARGALLLIGPRREVRNRDLAARHHTRLPARPDARASCSWSSVGMPVLPSRETLSAADQAAVAKHSAGERPFASAQA